MLCLQCAKVAGEKGVDGSENAPVGDGERCGPDETKRRKFLSLSIERCGKVRAH